MIAAAVLTFAACSTNDVINEVQTIDEEVAISFDGKYISKVTRAELTQSWFTTTDNKFGVEGFKASSQIFSNEQVNWNGSDWVHTTVRFWDKSSDEYSFYAYAPYDVDNTSWNHTFDATNKKYTFTSVPVIKDIDAAANDADIAIATPRTGVSYLNGCTHQSVGGHGAGHVEFDFNHILSKLAFKVKTSVPTDQAEIKVTAIELNFPSGAATWTQTAAGAVAGTTSYTSYTAAETGTITYETPVFSGTTAALNSSAADIVDASSSSNKAKTFIVAPVAASGDGTEHIFGIKVTYTLKYLADNITETGCVATGILGGGSSPTEAPGQYKPAQNSSYVVTIDVNPAQIKFCVDEVVGWDTVTGRDVTVSSN